MESAVRVSGANYHLFELVWRNGPPNFLDRLILLALLDHADDDGVTRLSLGNLSRLLGTTPPSVLSHMRRLRDDGWVTWEKRRRRIDGGPGGAPNEYRVSEDRLRQGVES